MEREVGGGIGMGNTCKPLAVSFQCMTKSTTTIKKKKKKKEKKNLGFPEQLACLHPLASVSLSNFFCSVFCKIRG